MSKRKALPLVSSNWLPLKDVYDRLRQRLGSNFLALRDLNAAFRCGNIRTKARQPEGHQDGLRLSPDFWDDFKIADGGGGGGGFSADSDEGVWVFGADGVRMQGWIYVWEPDFRKIGGGEVAPTLKIEEASKQPIKMGTPLQHEVVEITLEIAWRLYHEKQVPGKRGREKFAGDISDWCERRFKSTPSDKYLLKIIAAAMRKLD